MRLIILRVQIFQYLLFLTCLVLVRVRWFC